jgi:uracil-DNA glycosylase
VTDRGVALLDARRRALLDAMGIVIWEDRRNPAVEAPHSTPAVTARKPGEPDSVALLDWAALEQRVAGCTACALHRERSRTVFGVGNHAARLLVVGEAPGAEEDRRGEPFVGRAGQLLNAMLAAIGQPRENVYIANIVKCRPPGNRDPLPAEAAACSGFLARQIALVRPCVILAVGRIAAQNLLGVETPIGRLRGRTHTYGPDALPVIVTYHPAYLLRSPDEKRKVWTDLLVAKDLLDTETKP